MFGNRMPAEVSLSSVLWIHLIIFQYCTKIINILFRIKNILIRNTVVPLNAAIIHVPIFQTTNTVYLYNNIIVYSIAKQEINIYHKKK